MVPRLCVPSVRAIGQCFLEDMSFKCFSDNSKWQKIKMAEGLDSSANLFLVSRHISVLNFRSVSHMAPEISPFKIHELDRFAPPSGQSRSYFMERLFLR